MTRSGPGRDRDLRGGAGRWRSLPWSAAAIVVAALIGCGSAPDGDGGSAGGGESSATGSAVAGAPAEASPSEAAPPGRSGRLEVSDLGINAGAPDAPIQVVEFSDFGCPHCRAFHEEVYPVLHEEYVETGRVIWKYVPFVLGLFPNSVEAARAGECGIEQDGFEPLRARLFATQEAWRASDEPTELFIRLAREEGLDADRFRSCMEERWTEERLLRSLKVGAEVDLDRTPTFFVQGRRLEGARSADTFREIFDRLAEARDAGEEGEAP